MGKDKKGKERDESGKLAEEIAETERRINKLNKEEKDAAERLRKLLEEK